ncbi:MAG: class I SAM-dependent methyltransferase [Chloroflexaceae bacterium]|nr:class I SAM-dependent methyltransferase [Chloroflexaceae bacterium]
MSVIPPLEEKASYIKRSFADIATTYDRTNSVMTFGMHQLWRHYVVEAMAAPVDGRALDVGTGTGDFLPLLSAWMPHGMAVGVDFCLPMMHAGQAKLDSSPASDIAAETVNHNGHPEFQLPDTGKAGMIALVGGDGLMLPFADNSFDVITTGFVMRNVTNIGAAFAEMWRVTRPGGTVGCLEVAQPKNPLLRLGHGVYFHQIVPWIGGMLSGNYRFYRYLPRSATLFPAPDQLAQIMQAAGWQHVHYRLLGFGAVAVHVGVKLP